MNKPIIALDHPEPTKKQVTGFHILAVYGSLKEGSPLHGHISHLHKIGVAKTSPIYRMYDLGWYPGLREEPRNGISVIVELYQCDPETMTRLDHVEGHPNLFKRSQIRLIDGSTATGYLYQHDCSHRKDAGSNWEKKR